MWMVFSASDDGMRGDAGCWHVGHGLGMRRVLERRLNGCYMEGYELKYAFLDIRWSV